MNKPLIILLASLLAVFVAASQQASFASPTALRLPAGFTSSVVSDDFNLPIDAEFLPNGDLLVAEKGFGDETDGLAAIKLLDSLTLELTVVLELNTNARTDSGLISIVTSPQFAENGHLYVWYATARGALNWTGESQMRLSRFTFDDAARVFPSSSEQIVLQIDTWKDVHNGGGMWFDASGNLLLAIGDMGLGPEDNAPSDDLGRLEGKLIRIRPNATTYTIPDDNPYVNTAGVQPEIFAVGLRNPFRGTFDAVGNRGLVADVGAATWEEVNIVTSGANFGWPHREGPCALGQDLPCGTTPPQFTVPTISYHHDFGKSATGVAFSDTSFPEQYRNKLFHADFSAGFIGVSSLDGSFGLFATDYEGIVDLEFSDSRLYVVNVREGEVQAIEWTGGSNQPPVVSLSAETTLTQPDTPIAFQATIDDPDDFGPFVFEWQFGDGTSATAATTALTHRYAENGNYTAQLVVTDPQGARSNVAKVDITIYDGELPTISITNQTDSSRDRYHAGDTIAYAAQRSTVADLSTSTPFVWRIDFHHDQHTHPFVTNNVTLSDQFEVPTFNHDNAWQLWYRLILTMNTSDGIAVEVSRDLFPVTAAVTVETHPGPHAVTFNQVRMSTPFTLPVIAGIETTIVAQPTLFFEGGIYQPDGWQTGQSTSSSSTLTFSAPASDTTVTAVYSFERDANTLFMPIVVERAD